MSSAYPKFPLLRYLLWIVACYLLTSCSLLPGDDSADTSADAATTSPFDREPAPPSATASGDPLQVELLGLDAEAQLPLRENIELLLSIWKLQGQPIPSESRLRWLHTRASEEIRQALQPFGYYDPQVQASLEQDSEGWRASYQVEPGPPLPVTVVEVDIIGEGRDDPAFAPVQRQLEALQGETLVHSGYLDSKGELQGLATERGYFQANFTRSEVQVDLAAYEAMAYLTLDTGPRYRFGQVSFGDSALDPEFLQRYVSINVGDPYLAGDLLRLQGDLIASDYFSQVNLDARPDNAEGNTLPVGVELEMRKRTRYTFGLGYGTDTGPRGKVGVERRWVNRWGHKARAELEASLVRQGIGAGYTIPGRNPLSDEWQIGLSFTRESLNDRESLTGRLGGEYRIKRGNWTGSNYLAYLYEDFTIGNDEGQTGILLPGVDWTWISAEDPLNIRSGGRLRLMLQGSYEFAISDISFLQTQVGFKWIQSFANRHRLIARTDLGTTLIADEDFPRFPSSLRFYTGGDNSVRGYKRDSIGPLDEDDQNVGGKHLVVASLEYEYRFLDKWAVAVFADAGDAFDNESPELRAGVGFGVRWYSPIGPIKVDLASGLTEPGDPIRLHFTVGPEL